MASILVAEFDPGVRLYTQVIFRDAGHRVTAVGDADQALTMMATNRFDLALLGDLPDPAGAIEVVRRRDERAVATRTRVVIQSADRLATELETFGLAVEVVTKPARSWELLAFTRFGGGLELV